MDETAAGGVDEAEADGDAADDDAADDDAADDERAGDECRDRDGFGAAGADDVCAGADEEVAGADEDIDGALGFASLPAHTCAYDFAGGLGGLCCPATYDQPSTAPAFGV